MQAIIHGSRTPLVFTVATVAAVAGFQWLPAGFVYNGRWLPFFFFLTALLAAYGVGELFRLGGRWLQLDVWQAPLAVVLAGLACLLGAFTAGGIAVPGFQPSSKSDRWCPAGSRGTTPGSKASRAGRSIRGSFACLIRQAGPTGVDGSGSEYITETQNPFGSTEATMALPYWTNGCMDTIDGVLFQSSTTTPFHFLDQAEYPSRANPRIRSRS